MSPDVDIRPAMDADADTIARIWHAGWRDGHLDRVPARLAEVRTEESFYSRARERVGDTTVAVVGGEVAGFVMIANDELEQVYVAETHRGTGVAAALAEEAEHQIYAAGHSRAWLAVVAGNERARSFYERQGWVDEGPFIYKAASADGSIAVPCHRYVKDLTPRS